MSEPVNKRVIGAGKQVNRRASGPVLQSVFFTDLDHSAIFNVFSPCIFSQACNLRILSLMSDKRLTFIVIVRGEKLELRSLMLFFQGMAGPKQGGKSHFC